MAVDIDAIPQRVQVGFVKKRFLGLQHLKSKSREPAYSQGVRR